MSRFEKFARFMRKTFAPIIGATKKKYPKRKYNHVSLGYNRKFQRNHKFGRGAGLIG